MKITSAGSAMVRSNNPPAAAAVTAEHPVALAGRLLVRYGLVIVIAWIGALKYGSYEAAAIQPLIAHSPLLSWLYHIFSVRALAAVLGTAEITAALLIALRPAWPRISAAGSAFGVLLFLSTLSFLFSTPGTGGGGNEAGFPRWAVALGQVWRVADGTSVLGCGACAIRGPLPPGLVMPIVVGAWLRRSV